MPAKSTKKPFEWWKLEHEGQFPTVGYLARQILGIIGSQIKIERVFSIAGILTMLRRCRLGSKNLDQLVLLVKNWPDDPRQGCEAKSLEEFGVEKAQIIDQL